MGSVIEVPEIKKKRKKSVTTSITIIIILIIIIIIILIHYQMFNVRKILHRYLITYYHM